VTIYLKIPEGTPFPNITRKTEGVLQVDPDFVHLVAEASNIKPEQLDDDALSELLVNWYIERIKVGYPHSEIMDKIIAGAKNEKD